MAVRTRDAIEVMATLQRYDRVLLAADHAPALWWMRSRPERPGTPDVWRLPRPTLMLRFFVRNHVRRAVETLHRRLCAERALGRSPAAGDEEQAVARYLEAVPPAHGRAIAVAVAAACLVLGRLAVQYAGEALSRFPALTHVHEGGLFSSVASSERSREAGKLMHRLGDALTAGVPEPSKVLDVLLSARPADLAVVASAASLALYVVLRPLVPAFRLKRALFNVEGDVAVLAVTTVRWHVARRTGVYDLEDRVFGRLGTRPPREVPFDLLVSGLLCVVPLGLGGYLLSRAGWWARWEPEGFVLYDVTFVIAWLLLFIACVRVAWLAGTWRRRRRGAGESRPPYDVRLADARHVVVRDPLAVGVLVFLLPQAFVVWLCAAMRDLRRVNRVAPRGAGGSWRWWGGLAGATALGWALLQVPVAPMTFLVPIGTLQYWPGLFWPVPVYWSILSVASAPVAAYIQASANRRWEGSGRRVWEGPP